MNVLNQYVKFLKDYNKLLERGTKNIFDSPNYIWLDNILKIDDDNICSSIIPTFFSQTQNSRESLILTIKKPLKPIIVVSNFYSGRIYFDDAKNKFESISDEDLEDFLQSPEGKEQISKLEHFKEAKRIYSKLFNAYNDTKNDTNQEVVLSVALIQFSKQSEKNDIVSVTKINQHLFHFPLRVELLASNILQVLFLDEDKPYADFFFLNNTPIKKETLDNIIDKFEAEVDLLGYKYLYDIGFKNLIQNTLQQISENSIFNDLLQRPTSDQSKLDTFEISFSPAINIKAKKPRFFEKLTESIIQFNEENKPEAPLMNLLLRNPEFKNGNSFLKSNYFTDELFERYKDENVHLDKNDFSAFFPLPHNKEQKEIHDKYQNNRLTVVTGPPGTGKSHSIVNILCCLLAQGKRVLVTAQTDKALESLLDKIPKQFDDLIFTKIKLANSNRFSLEKSIDKIGSIVSSARIIDIEEKLKKLDGFKSKYVHCKNEINTTLENEYKLFDFSKAFKGIKNFEIFEKLNNKDSNEWKWIKDEVDLALIDKSDEIKKAIDIYKVLHLNQFNEIKFNLDIPQLIKDFNEFEFREYFDLKITVSKLKDQLGMNNSIDEKKLLELDNDSIKSVLKNYNNSDINLKDIQLLNRLFQKFRSIDEFEEDVFSNKSQNELIEHRSKYINDIETYISIINADDDKVTFFNKLFNKNYKRVKYLESITINNKQCFTKIGLEKLKIYINSIFEIDRNIKEIGRHSFYIEASDTLTLNEKIRSYNKLINLIIINKNILEILEENRNIKLITEFYNLNPIDVNSIYQISIKNSDKFKLLQEAIVKLFRLNDKLKILNTKLDNPEIRMYANQNITLSNVEKNEDLNDLRKFLQDLHNNVLQKNAYLESKIFLEKNIPNTFPFLLEIPSAYIKKDSFEYAFAFAHLRENTMTDFQKIKDTLKYYYEGMSKTKSEILFELAKFNFQNKFDENEIDTFINILNNYKYNLSQANRTIQNSAKFKNLARKNSIEISQKLSCWIMKFTDVLNSLGNEPDVFDCIIVDEASQLDFNSLLLSYYTKNMIVVGDDKQTSPNGLNGVSLEDLEAIRDKNLVYLNDEKIHIRNDNSLFSLAKMVAGSANLSLKEHFRCVPEIIAFSRDKFYNSSLRPLKQLNSNRLTPKVSVYVEDSFLENKIVKKEITAIKDYIIELLENPAYEKKTIGVVSLGSRDHTDKLAEITEELIDNFDKEKIEKHNIIIDDAAKFQGDERDVMLISLGVALDLNKMSRNEEPKPQRIINNEQNLTDSLKSINVALSRAKEQMVLFHSLNTEDLKSGDFRAQIIGFFKEQYTSIAQFQLPPNISKSNRTRENVPAPFDSWFEYDIADVLIQNNYNYIKPQYEVKEKELWNNPRTNQNSYVYFKLDLVIFFNGKSVAIECDGDPFHSSFEDVAYDVERQEFLERVGWRIYRILYSKFNSNRELEIEKLLSFIQSHTF